MELEDVVYVVDENLARLGKRNRRRPQRHRAIQPGPGR